MNQFDVGLRYWLDGYRVSSLIAASVYMGIFEILSEAPATVAEMEGKTEWIAPKIERILNGLVHLKLVMKAKSGHYGLTPVGERLSQKSDSGLRSYALLVRDYVKAWSHIEMSLIGQVPYHTVCGRTVWDRRDDLELNSAFAEVMALHAPVAYELLLPRVFDEGTLADVAGGDGQVLYGVLLARPKLKGLLLERPLMLEAAKKLAAYQTLEQRVALREANLLELLGVPPTRVDGCVLCNVLHDWPDQEADRILWHCASITKPGGKLYIIERLVEPGREADTAMQDLHMLVVTGGRQRTFQEMVDLADVHGFINPERIDHPSGFSLLEFDRSE